MQENYSTDVIIVGAGNAAFSAAVSAKENGAKVLILEKVDEKYMGGNSALTIHMRFAYNSFEDLLPLIKFPNSKIELNEFNKKIDTLKQIVTPYTKEDYINDIDNVTENKSDKKLSKELVNSSLNTIQWMNNLGHFWMPTFENPTSANVVSFEGKGFGLISRWKNIATKMGIQITYNSPVVDLIKKDNKICGVIAIQNNKKVKIYAKSTILACGSFESNPQMRAKYLGNEWKNIKLRGVPHNTGEGLEMAINYGAVPYDDWSTCHASPQDINRPEFDLPGKNKSGDYWSRYAYPFSFMINQDGNRFVDEGETWRGLTYAKTGKAIINQKNQVAYQIFDSKHRKSGVLAKYNNATKYIANNLEDLLNKIKIEDKNNLLSFIDKYNNSINNANFDPHILDGKSNLNIQPNRNNWALPLDTPPYEAYPTIAGMTFCYGGIKTTIDGEVVNKNGDIINGLFAVGEMLGGLWYKNYPSGGGMMAGSVFGKKAGKKAS
tara:strand:- start:2842 stop:4317 length:1476 start_codon:yes stop_codon:yes gene_type:complete